MARCPATLERLRRACRASRGTRGRCNRVHVLHVYNDVYPPVAGGIEKHIDSIRRALPDVRSDVLVCARSRRGSSKPYGSGIEVKVAELGPRVWSVPIAPTFPARLRGMRADVVHLHMPNPLGELAVLADRRRPLVCSYHADVVRQARVAPIYRRLVHACLGRADQVIVGSSRLAETSPFLGPYAHTAEILPYFVDTDQLSRDRVSEPDRATLRARYGTPVVLAVARLVYYKGLDILIEAARSLDASIVIVGDGPLAGELRRLAETSRNVHLVGTVSESELLRHLAIADCFVLPSTSRAESFGISVLEAQAMSVPAVVTDVGTGTVEAISPGETGLVVSPGDANALAEAIRTILSDPMRREAMGRRARERAVAQHSAAEAAARLREIYRRVAT
jgi:glycosyltransferase involved in cell wall biosynthesis